MVVEEGPVVCAVEPFREVVFELWLNDPCERLFVHLREGSQKKGQVVSVIRLHQVTETRATRIERRGDGCGGAQSQARRVVLFEGALHSRRGAAALGEAG